MNEFTPTQFDPTQFERHDVAWNDRLQDLLDAEISASERTTTESHIATCGRCRMQYAHLKRLDAKLAAKLAVAPLDNTFDRQLFARIESLDANARERARRRLERELQENLNQLSRGWHRTLAFVVGGAIAGIALAFAVISWIDAAGLTNRLVDAAAAASGSLQASTLHAALTVSIVAAMGTGLSKWLASNIE
jgi:anti-sigma factor RsiW